MVVALVALAVGFAAGFMLRPVIAPATPAAVTAGSTPVAVLAERPRGTQYFAAHLDEARAIVAGCRDGSVRGDECANAGQAVLTADSRERAAKFLGKRPG